MEILSIAVLVLLSMFGYSMGAVATGRKSWPRKPQPTDLLLMLLIWSGAIATRLILGWNGWLLVPGWLGLAFLTGRLSRLFRKFPPTQSLMPPQEGARSRNPLKNLWLKWKDLSGRTGNFQSRLVLSYFYFLFVTPFGLAVKIFGDPLRIKGREKTSYWLSRPEPAGGLDSFRKQS
jgi:hypothetical protein